MTKALADDDVRTLFIGRRRAVRIERIAKYSDIDPF
jgi:hypothetical protein